MNSIKENASTLRAVIKSTWRRFRVTLRLDVLSLLGDAIREESLEKGVSAR